MKLKTINLQQAEIAEQHDRMVGLFVALCIGSATGAIATLALLLS